MHTQIPSGLNRCPLDHYEGCPGGYVDGKAANGSEWRGCPPNFVPKSPKEIRGSTESVKDDLEITDSPRSVNGSGDEVFNKVHQTGGETLKDAFAELTVSGNGGVENEELENDDLLNAQTRNKLLREQVEKLNAEKQEQEKQEQVRQIRLLEVENARLESLINGDTGAVTNQ